MDGDGRPFAAAVAVDRYGFIPALFLSGGKSLARRNLGNRFKRPRMNPSLCRERFGRK
jgi:hypothetical protein